MTSASRLKSPHARRDKYGHVKEECFLVMSASRGWKKKKFETHCQQLIVRGHSPVKQPSTRALRTRASVLLPSLSAEALGSALHVELPLNSSQLVWVFSSPAEALSRAPSTFQMKVSLRDI